MKVDLVHISPITLVIKAIRKCWKSNELSDSDYVNDILGVKDSGLLRAIIRSKHESTLEHSQLTFEIDGISRALLQELSRHRIGVSPSVESTRYTMNKILNNNDISNCLVKTNNPKIDSLNEEHMTKLLEIIKEDGLTNDVAKYGLVEAYKVSEIITFNFRSFRHFLELRTSNRALKEIRELAFEMVKCLPDKYLILIEDK